MFYMLYYMLRIKRIVKGRKVALEFLKRNKTYLRNTSKVVEEMEEAKETLYYYVNLENTRIQKYASLCKEAEELRRMIG